MFRALQVPLRVRLVDDDQVARLEEARRGIGFVPTNGFLHTTQVVRPCPLP
jgi:pantothenate synthetase